MNIQVIKKSTRRLLALAFLLTLCALSMWTQRNSAQQGQSPAGANQLGRLTSSGNSQKRTSFQYDALGRVTSSTQVFEGSNSKCLGRPCTFPTSYGYPQNPDTTPGLGTVTRLQFFPDGERVDYGYDAGGAQQSIKTTPFRSEERRV